MSLSVTSAPPGAPSALAVLQALSMQTPASQTSAQQASGSGAVSGAAPTARPPSTIASSASLSASASAGGASSLFAVADGVGQALTVADAADAAGQSVMGLLQQMRSAAGQAADPSLSSGDRLQLDRRFQASVGQIAPTLAGATVNGINLVDGSMASGLKVALGDGATASLTPVDLSLGGSTLGLPPDASLATPDGAALTLASLGGAIGGASAGLSALQTQADQIGAHAGFVQTLGHALISPEQDGGDSVRLMALQVSQQLAAHPSAIANQSPQSILSLFRN